MQTFKVYYNGMEYEAEFSRVLREDIVNMLSALAPAEDNPRFFTVYLYIDSFGRLMLTQFGSTEFGFQISLDYFKKNEGDDMGDRVVALSHIKDEILPKHGGFRVAVDTKVEYLPCGTTLGDIHNKAVDMVIEHAKKGGVMDLGGGWYASTLTASEGENWFLTTCQT